MSKLSIQGISQKQFEQNVKSALEIHSGSPVTKDYMTTRAVKAILGEANEHLIPAVFLDEKSEEKKEREILSQIYVATYATLDAENLGAGYLGDIIYATCVGKEALERKLREFFCSACGDSDNISCSALEFDLVERAIREHCGDDEDEICDLKSNLLEKGEVVDWMVENIDIDDLIEPSFLRELNMGYAEVHWEQLNVEYS